MAAGLAEQAEKHVVPELGDATRLTEPAARLVPVGMENGKMQEAEPAARRTTEPATRPNALLHE